MEERREKKAREKPGGWDDARKGCKTTWITHGTAAAMTRLNQETHSVPVSDGEVDACELGGTRASSNEGYE